MKHFAVLLVISFFILTQMSSIAVAKAYQDNDGMYFGKRFKSQSGLLHYHVDSITQTCFIIYSQSGGGAITEVSCSDLAKRPDWKPIITWVKN